VKASAHEIIGQFIQQMKSLGYSDLEALEMFKKVLEKGESQNERAK
jgi:DNA-binding transcriptional regulator YhcF (GntR family)